MWTSSLSWGISAVLLRGNLMRQMVCYTEPSEKSSMETVWKRAGTFKKYLAGDWMNHLSITVLLCKAAGLTRSRENPHRTLIGPNDRGFGHKRITWSLTRWILTWSHKSSCLSKLRVYVLWLDPIVPGPLGTSWGQELNSDPDSCNLETVVWWNNQMSVFV